MLSTSATQLGAYPPARDYFNIDPRIFACRSFVQLLDPANTVLILSPPAHSDVMEA